LNTTPYLVRLVAAADVDAVAHLHVAVWQAAYRGLLPDAFLDAISVERRAAMWRQIVERQASPALVAERDGRIVGFVLGGPSQDDDAQPGVTAEILAIYVAPDRWSTGAGVQLMREALTVLRNQGFQEVTLWVLRDNVRARRFYELVGFKPDGGEKVDVQAGVTFDEVRYRLRIG
jgi:ribosomal protein S18 acetylase RimI-like enzyme